MKRGALLLLSALCAAPLLYAAELSGTVRISELHDGRPVELEDHSNAVIFLGGFQEPPPAGRKQELSQENKTFLHRVLTVTQGESVAFPNLDKIFHNVWSQSRPKTFDLGLYKYPEVKVVEFDKPGFVTVFCNIHPQMIATILVLPNNKSALTNPAGKYRITGIPPGEWPVYAWVEGATPLKLMLSFKADSALTQDFKLTLNRIPIRHLNKEGKPYQNY